MPPGARPAAADVALVIEGLGCGGAQRVAAHLVDGWTGRGRQVALITLRQPDEDFFSVNAGVRRYVIGGVSVSAHAAAALAANAGRVRRLRAAIRASGAQVVVSFVTSTNVLAIAATRGLGVRLVISERNDPARQPIDRAWAMARRATYRLADVVTANSEAAIETMAAYVPARKLAYLANPVVMPRGLADPAGSTTILTVGRLAPQKQHALIVDALALLPSSTEWRLLVVGDGPEQGRLQTSIRRQGLDARVAFQPPRPDPGAFYRQAGIFVLASAYEGTPNALLEAMAHGVPCAVPDDLPGARALVEDDVTGRVFRSGDTADLARVVTALLGDGQLRARLGTAARSRAARHDIARVLADVDALAFPAPRRRPR
jgi:glycosyltransferase involved in cell wall biosynthesis